MRRAVQIEVTPGHGDEYQLRNGQDNVYVLCDDGTIWFRTTDIHNQSIWLQMPPIPQDNGDTNYEPH